MNDHRIYDWFREAQSDGEDMHELKEGRTGKDVQSDFIKVCFYKILMNNDHKITKYSFKNVEIII